MPVSYFPCVLPLLLIAVPLLCLTRGKKPFLIASTRSLIVLILVPVLFYIPGWLLMVKAKPGNPEAQ